MGAGTAALLTTMLRESLPGCAEARCYAMACPACLTYELADSCRDYVTSIINGTDIVPTFSGGRCLARLWDPQAGCYIALHPRNWCIVMDGAAVLFLAQPTY